MSRFLPLIFLFTPTLIFSQFSWDRDGGEVTTRAILHDDGIFYTTKSTNTEKQETVIEKRRRSDGFVISQTLLKQDQQGRYLSGQVKDHRGNIQFLSQFIYASDGKLKEERITDPTGRWISSLGYRYNNAGKSEAFVFFPEQSGSQRIVGAEVNNYSTTSSTGYSGVPRASTRGPSGLEQYREKESTADRRVRLLNRSKDRERKGLFRR